MLMANNTCRPIKWVIVSSVLLHIFAASSIQAQTPDVVAEKMKQLLDNVKARTEKNDKQKNKQTEKRAEHPRYAISKDGYLKHLGAPQGHYFPVTDTDPEKPDRTARNFLKEHAELFGVISTAVDFRVIKSSRKDSRKHIKFEQTYAGLPVFGAQTIVQLNEYDGVEYVLSDIARDVRALDKKEVQIIPTISPEEAVSRGRDLFKGRGADITINTTTPILRIFDPSVLDSAGSIKLVWDLDVYSEGRTDINVQILLDAHTGEVVRKYPKKIPELNRDVFDSGNTTAEPGTLRRSDTENPPGPGASGIPDVDAIYDALGSAWNFYWNEHDRDSIDDGGMVLSASVRLCSSDTSICGNPPQCPCRNAFWYESRLFFGEGLISDDTVGHEYTHGVTQETSNLIYENQSGAINESFSDMWGEFIDLTNNIGNDSADARWKLSEDDAHYAEDAGFGNESGAACGNLIDDDGDGLIDEGCPDSCTDGIDNWADGADVADPDCYLRNLKDPSRKGQPDRMGSNLYFTGTADYGGVHTNSGVGNKLAFLLTDGETFNGQTVVGTGISRVADLYYEVQVNLLPSGANYLDLYLALRQAAVNLGWSSEEKNNLYRAGVAVEIVNFYTQLYVDNANSCLFPSGSPSCDAIFGGPFTTVADALNEAFPETYLYIAPGLYPENVTFDKIMRIQAWGSGAVVIGQ